MKLIQTVLKLIESEELSHDDILSAQGTIRDKVAFILKEKDDLLDVYFYPVKGSTSDVLLSLEPGQKNIEFLDKELSKMNHIVKNTLELEG